VHMEPPENPLDFNYPILPVGPLRLADFYNFSVSGTLGLKDLKNLFSNSQKYDAVKHTHPSRLAAGETSPDSFRIKLHTSRSDEYQTYLYGYLDLKTQKPFEVYFLAREVDDYAVYFLSDPQEQQKLLDFCERLIQ